MNLQEIQNALRDHHFDGWLFYDHHHRDPLAYRILNLDQNMHVTRRWFYFIPVEGQPRKLVHRIENGRLDSLPGTKREYSSWQELEMELASTLAGHTKLAMQYSPRNAIMAISLVDAGTIELIRAMDKEIVSSADLVSQFEAVLSKDQIVTHYAAQEKIDRILASAWISIGDQVHGSGTNEFAVTKYLQQAMMNEGLVWEHGPNVSCGANSANSHYEPSRDCSRPIGRGDFILIDIWGKLDRPNACFYDITWTGVVAREPTEREHHIFAIVQKARDAAIHTVQEAFSSGNPIPGWKADDAARNVIRAAGFGPWFTHRTGHNISAELHGNGAHLDNLETHDERLLLPNTCFSVEPGIYFPDEFGVRSEVNILTQSNRAEVTGCIQTELMRI